MKIKGVERDKRKRGQVVELDAKAKAYEAAKMGVKAATPDRHVHIFGDAKVLTVESQSMGPRKDKKKFANNTYNATGEVTFKLFEPNGSKLRPSKKLKFTTRFEDCLDNWGMPDIKLIEFKMS